MRPCLPLILLGGLAGLACLGACEADLSASVDTSDGHVPDVADARDAPDLKELEPPDALTPDAGPLPDDGVAEATGVLYLDPEGRASSHYAQRLRPESPRLPGISLSLLGPGGTSGRAETDSEGRFTFSSLTEGRYLLDLDIDPSWRCTSANLARRLPRAVTEGHVQLVTFGDSVPAWGPRPWLSERLADILRTFAEATDTNLAVPGSVSTEWLPGAALFRTLEPALDGADVVIFSLGGNDLQYFLLPLLDLPIDVLLANLESHLRDFEAEVDRVRANLETIITAIRARAPEADIVWFVYPNYAHNDFWTDQMGGFDSIVQGILGDTLTDLRTEMSRVDRILLADMLGAIHGDAINAFMLDELHLNAAGHRFYAEVLFELLGGVTVEAEGGLGLERALAFQRP